MALTVEDGSGLEDADAFVSVEYADAYHESRGNAGWDGDDETIKEPAIRRATTYIEGKYGRRWSGYRIFGRAQALSWPRVGAVDREGITVLPDEVPREVIAATCEAALRELVAPGSLTPDVTVIERIKREQIGPISTEYAGSSDPREARPVVTIIDEILAPLLATPAMRLSGTVSRG